MTAAMFDTWAHEALSLRHIAGLGTLLALSIWVVCAELKERRYSFYKLQGPPNESLLLSNLRSYIGIGVGATPVEWFNKYGLTHYVRLGLSQRVLRSSLSPRWNS